MDDRNLEFLKDVHKQIVVRADDMPRMIFTAMTYRLNWYHVHAAQTLGLVEKEGWRWKWKGPAPHPDMAVALKEEVAARIKNGSTVPLFRRPKARKRYAELIGKTGR